jgi:hypothetical protein
VTQVYQPVGKPAGKPAGKPPAKKPKLPRYGGCEQEQRNGRAEQYKADTAARRLKNAQQKAKEDAEKRKADAEKRAHLASKSTVRPINAKDSWTDPESQTEKGVNCQFDKVCAEWGLGQQPDDDDE